MNEGEEGDVCGYDREARGNLSSLFSPSYMGKLGRVGAHIVHDILSEQKPTQV